MKNAPVAPESAEDQDFEEEMEGEDGDIMQILHRDHVKVDELFFQYKQTDEESQKKEIVAQITLELGLHAKAEEELIYPVVRNGKEEVEDMMDEADTEHHVVKFLLEELASMQPSDSHYDSKVTVLCELVKHHVEEEEEEIFEKLKNSDEDLEELGQLFLDKKMQLSQRPLPQETFPVVGTKQLARKSA